MKRQGLAILLLTASINWAACTGKNGSGSGSTIPRFDSGDNEIADFIFPENMNTALGADAAGTISGDIITITLPYGTTVTSLIAEFTSNSKDVKVNGVKQISGETSNDFSADITYAVTAENGDTRNYTVRVSIAPPSEKEITQYALDGYPGIIDQEAGTIRVFLPPKTDITSLTASFTAICESVYVGQVEQVSGETVNDFTGGLTYRVTAADGSSRDYSVTAEVQKATWNELGSFIFEKELNPGLAADVMADISGTSVSAILPYGSSAENLVATFTTTGEGVSADGVAQQSGVTANNFTSSMEYTVTAEDGSEKIYTIYVSIAENSEKLIVTYYLDGEKAAIDQDGGTINTIFQENKDLTSLIAGFTSTGVSVSAGGVEQASGLTANDFTDGVTYTVLDANSASKEYRSTVTGSSEIAGIWNFQYDGSTEYKINQAVHTTGISGNAYSFDGYNDYVLVPYYSALAMKEAGSIEVLFKGISFKENSGLVHKGMRKDFSDEAYSLSVIDAAGNLRLSVTGSDGKSSWIETDTGLSTDSWYHVVATWDTSSRLMRIYINGRLEAEGDCTTGPLRDITAKGGGDLLIGAQMAFKLNNTLGYLGFNGIIDRVELRTTALPADEVSARFEALPELQESWLTAFIMRVRPSDRGMVLLVLLAVAAITSFFWLRNRSRCGKESC